MFHAFPKTQSNIIIYFQAKRKENQTTNHARLNEFIVS